MKFTIPTTKENAISIFELKPRKYIAGNNKCEEWLKENLKSPNLNSAFLQGITTMDDYLKYLNLENGGKSIAFSANKDLILSFLKKHNIRHQEIE